MNNIDRLKRLLKILDKNYDSVNLETLKEQLDIATTKELDRWLEYFKIENYLINEKAPTLNAKKDILKTSKESLFLISRDGGYYPSNKNSIDFNPENST